MLAPKENTIDYIEVPSADLAATKAFFTQLFGWSFTDYGPDYIAFEDGRISGGFYRSDKLASVLQGSVLVIFYAKDLAATLARCKQLKATLSKEIFSFPGGRRFHFIAPGTGEFAVWSDV
jgi:predicted enzyme related to lactoylglutathione lyase